MLKILLIFLAGVCIISCQAYKPALQPQDGPHFRSLNVKFHFQDGEIRQNGRVLWRFDERLAKFLFFSPLNQVGMELAVDGEDAVLVNHGKKAFWRGDFSLLLERIWGIAVAHTDLKSLIAGNGTTPAGFADRGITVALERAAGCGALETVRLSRGAADLSLRILKDELRPGTIVRLDYAERYRPLDLENVLDDD